MPDPVPAQRTPELRIVVVDDHEIVREGLRALLDSVPGLEVVGEAETASGAVRVVRQLVPDVVVMDNRLGDGSGISACRDIMAERPQTRVLVLTAFPDELAAAAALRAGAAGFLLKKITGDALIKAVTGTSSEMVIDADLLRRLAGAVDHNPVTLTRAERMLAALVADGLTNADIAGRLRIPVATVKSQVSHLLAHLGVACRSEISARLAELDTPTPDA